MPDSSAEGHVQTILRDIACPSCEYNLRGLSGPVVTCPECGAASDLAKLVTAKWEKPWYRAPGLNRVFMPIFVAVLGLLGVPIVGGFSSEPALFVPVVATVALGTWVAALIWAGRMFSGIEGYALALLSHALLAGYMLSVFGTVAVVILAISAWSDGNALLAVLRGGLAVVLLAILWPCRRGEKFIAYRCIRRYLQKRHSEPA